MISSMAAEEVKKRYTKLEAALIVLAVILAIVSQVWFFSGEPGQRQGMWLLAPALALGVVVIVMRRRRGAPK